MNDPIHIIGAGIGGLSAAIRLAAAGRRVVVYEKNAQVGGKMAQISADGFRWDTGPSVITMRHVFDDLFAAAGRRLADYLELLPVEPLTRYFYPDGVMLDATRDLAAMAQQIARLDERDVEGYLAYLAYAARIHRITGPVFIYAQPPTWRSFLRVPPPDWLKVDGTRTMAAAIAAHVRTPHLRQLLGRFATYVGASPYLAPATLNVIAHVELTGGVWYPRGGIYQIAAALARLARELGVEIHTGRGVAQIGVENGRVAHLQLTDGQLIPTRTVLSNLDVTTTYHRLLPAVPYTPPLAPSCSGFILLLGVRGQTPRLAHHNIFFSADYPAEFDAIFGRGVPPDDPTIYVAITSKTDPDHAPPDHENWFVLVNAPPVGEAYDWRVHAAAYRDHVLARLAAHGVDVRQRIVSQHIWTPLDLQTHTGAWRGALYGQSSNSRLAAFRRPHNRAASPAGLYFAGGTTHPGGGVPMVTLSGHVAADLILEDAKGRNAKNAEERKARKD
ncbi:MAG: phytoene desaturase [Anaerolineales bacterium]|nr:phytoene desaturase [Anaerolineales bacterium]